MYPEPVDEPLERAAALQPDVSAGGILLARGEPVPSGRPSHRASAGCSKDGGERIVRPTSGDPAELIGDPAELIAWVSVAPVAFHAGEVVQIDVGIRNPTTRPTVVGFTSGSCRLTYAVTDRNDLVVAPGFVCTADAPTYELAPGETIAAKYSWDGISSSGTPLPPGEYQVHSSGFLYPRTTPVTIQILAP